LKKDCKNPWLYRGEIFDAKNIKDFVGFVYLITYIPTKRKYVGKKNFWSLRKDRKTGRRKTKESDWKNYFGSCDQLKEDIKQFGEDKFVREILYLCPHKKSMSFYEVMEQFKRNVIFSDEYYNTNIEGKYFSAEVDNIYNLVQPYMINDHIC